MDGDLPLPKGVKRQRDRAAIVREIDALPDDDIVSNADAAIYLNTSSKSLWRWAKGYDRKRYARSKKFVGEKGDIVNVKPVPGAPKPIKRPAAEGSAARNQHIFYRVGDLKRFKREMMERRAFEPVTNPMFADQMERLAQERAWFAEDGLIIDEATSAPKRIFDAWKRRDGSIELLSLSLVEAMCDYDWKKSETRAPWDAYFRDEVSAFAGDAASASASRQQAVRFAERPAKSDRPHPARARPRS